MTDQRTGYPTESEIRERRISKRRAAALQALKRAEAKARQIGGRLIVFGSLVEGGFGERSDLDIAVFDIPAGRDSDVAAEIDTLLALAGFEADVIPERFLSSSLRERVLRDGREPSTLG